MEFENQCIAFALSFVSFVVKIVQPKKYYCNQQFLSEEMDFVWVSEQNEKKPVRLKIPNYPLTNERDLNEYFNERNW